MLQQTIEFVWLEKKNKNNKNYSKNIAAGHFNVGFLFQLYYVTIFFTPRISSACFFDTLPYVVWILRNTECSVQVYRHNEVGETGIEGERKFFNSSSSQKCCSLVDVEKIWHSLS